MFASLTQAEVVRIASGEYPPWTSAELPDGGYINLLVKRAFNNVGIDVEFDYMPWNRALEATRVGHYLASSFWGHDPARDPDFLLSESIHIDPIVLSYNKRTPMIKWKKLEDLKGYVFGATRGYTYAEGFWEKADSDVLRVSVVNDDVSNLKKLISGDIDLFPISRLTALYLLNKHFSPEEAKQITFDTRPINSSLDYLLFTRAKAEAEPLLKRFNEGLAKLNQTHSSKQMLKAYIDECCSTEN